MFADSLIRCKRLQISRLAGNHLLHLHAEAAVGHQLPALWARRSRFVRLNRPLLVSGVLLPGMARLESRSETVTDELAKT